MDSLLRGFGEKVRIFKHFLKEKEASTPPAGKRRRLRARALFPQEFRPPTDPEAGAFKRRQAPKIRYGFSRIAGISARIIHRIAAKNAYSSENSRDVMERPVEDNPGWFSWIRPVFEACHRAQCAG
jgi:hypothetical protein